MDPIGLPMDIVEQQEEEYDNEKCKSNFKRPASGGLGDFEEIVSMPKQMILITLIAQQPAIYNPKHNDYRNTLKRDDVWMKISERVGWTNQHCKNKWKALRDQYCRELKRARSNSKAVIKWKYFKHLEFLKPYALYRNYRPKMSTRSQTECQEQQGEPKEQEQLKEDELCSTHKPDNWNLYSSSSSQMNESSTIASQVTDPISQSEKDDGVDEEPQDDEDDDPIHTFLNIESYFEKELITMIQSEEVLYYSQHPSYRNAKLKLRVWEDIARRLKRTVRQCRLKWKALRDQYIREHKRLLNMGNGKYLSRWKHYNALGFLEKCIRQKNSNDFKYNLATVQKSELIISSEHLDQEQIITPSTEEDQEMSHVYILGNDDTSQVFANFGHSSRSGEEERSDYIQQAKHNKLPIEEHNTLTIEEHNNLLAEEITDAQAAKDDNDEVGAFFRAIAMKIRKTNMSAMAFTELQIDILRMITKVLRNH